MNLIDAEDPVGGDEEERREHLRALELGVEIERFLDSRVGTYLMQRAEDQRDEALEELATVNPHDPVAVQTSQNKAQVALLFARWLRDGISAASNAHERLRQQNGE